MVTGLIFNLERYAVHDGPGIRTLVFTKGCPLRCIWCSNPEGQKACPELLLVKERCSGCGRCINVCPRKAIVVLSGLSYTDKDLCIKCGKCVKECPNQARQVVGTYVTVDWLWSEVKKDVPFYWRSGGGITVGGGEPTTQYEFVAQLLGKCRGMGIHTAIETCGYATWDAMQEVLEHTDLVLYDLKVFDPSIHEQLTGKPNNVIHGNLERICQANRWDVIVRIPIIPGYTDSRDNLVNLAKFVATVNREGSVKKIELIPYHRLGVAKYERLGRKYELQEHALLTEDEMDRFAKLVMQYAGVGVYCQSLQ